MTTGQQGGSPPPGWYPDPQGSGQQRYWDGSEWTSNVAPGAGAAQRPAPGGAGKPGPGKRGVPFFVALASCLLIVVGSIGPWARVLDAVTITGTGEGSDGWITIFCAVVAAALLAWWAVDAAGWKPIVAAVLGGIAVLVAIIDLIDVSTGTAGEIADPGWGLWLVFVAAIALTVASIVLRVTQPRAAA